MRRPVPSGAGRRVAPWAVLALVSLSLGGCYVYRPLYTAPTPDMRVVIEMNDRGRIALEQNIGPDAATIEGTLRAVSDSMLELSMIEVRTLYGGVVKWNGEPVTINQAYVRLMRERRYSRPHTFALVTALASSTVAFIATRGLFGIFRGSPDGTPGGPDQPGSEQ